ncbi:FAD-dependent oxidoreductase [Caulobacter sp. CCUG 60055]|uniref:NAD(P)/FAD-dependent oxidoreductase n=2 Tax=Pseudomonadota TaxID=1224 RepID=UPI001FA8172D|nr:NAD(P)/FAD-dependent oxidoreductase [Caulobacter sp. CCUG 60055]MCI3181575.1 FAD-dependent oxidoreductase [Caulobacter sp. CCUG 60055]
MSDTYETDLVVIGAGVVGLACGAAFARSGTQTLVLDSESRIGSHTSSRNSEVIHAGIYYPTGSLKHRLCIRGRDLLYSYLALRKIEHRRCGKLIVSTSLEEDEKLEQIYELSQVNGVKNVNRLTASQARALESEIYCTSAISSEDTGILDSHGLMLSLAAEIEDRGGNVVLRTPVLGARALDKGGFDVFIAGESPAHIRCKFLINAAGLYAARVAEALEMPSPVRAQTHFAKGSYFSCLATSPFERLIYPAPVKGGLGVHLTLDLAGRMRFGPDVEWLDHADPSKIDYAVDIDRAKNFYAAIRRYWPGLPDNALIADYSGCRPKAGTRREAITDFRIDLPCDHGQPGLAHLIGIESPGLTSALAIAEYVQEALKE